MQNLIEYPAYQLTSNGLECQLEKLKAIQCILPLTNVKQLKCYLGMVMFYCNIFKKQSHILGPLMDLAGKCGKTKSTDAKSK